MPSFRRRWRIWELIGVALQRPFKPRSASSIKSGKEQSYKGRLKLSRLFLWRLPSYGWCIIRRFDLVSCDEQINCRLAKLVRTRMLLSRQRNVIQPTFFTPFEKSLFRNVQLFRRDLRGQ